LSLRERRDAEIDKLRKKYAPRLAMLGEQVRRGEEKIQREKAQVSDQTLHTAISVGTTLLGALFGRKALSSANIGRAGTAMRGAGRIAREKGDVARAEEGVEVQSQKLTDLQSELDLEISRLQGELDPAVIDIETVSVKARKSDTSVTPAALVWVAG
jgi:multidrug resistance efflux pump